jgi:hypothetical protein
MKHILQSAANWYRIIFSFKNGLETTPNNSRSFYNLSEVVAERVIMQYISNILHRSIWKQILHFVVEYFRFTSWGAWNEMFYQNTQDVRANVSQFLLHLQGQWIYILVKKINCKYWQQAARWCPFVNIYLRKIFTIHICFDAEKSLT